MFSRKRALVGAAFLGVVLGGAASASAVAATTRNVGTCKAGAYPTISAAVAASNAGDTIKVCPGTYNENVAVGIPLTFLGAQAGKDARQGRNNAAKESVVDNVSGDFTLSSSANDVTIDGFTITGAGDTDGGPNDYGVEAFFGSSGLTLVNNIIRDNREGINFQNPDPNRPALIRRNAFVNNSTGNAGAGSGTGVFISNGPANNTLIHENDFTGHTETAINFAGNGASLSTGLVVKNNDSSDDATFVVATNSDGAEVSHNSIKVSAGFPNGSGILDFGSNKNLLIDENTLDGGNSFDTSGIRVRALSGTPSTNTRVTHNKVTGRYNGIRISVGSGDTIADNDVSKSTNVGIFADSAMGNLFSHNTVMLSGVHDCEDDTTGGGTAGTANTWDKNVGKSNNSLPPAICPKR